MASVASNSKMELNTNKAGMEGLDKTAIDKVIKEASEGSKFYEHQKRKEEKLLERLQKQRKFVETITPQELTVAQEKASKWIEELKEYRNFNETVIHMDMDAFFAAVEMRNDPTLRHIPMAVGGNSMLSTSNYAARRFGVRAAMPGFIAKKLCPHLKIVSSNSEEYQKASQQVEQILSTYDPQYSMGSLDEAYFNLTDYLKIREMDFPGGKDLERKQYSGDCLCRLPRLNDDSEKRVDGGPVDSYEESCLKCGKLATVHIDSVHFGNSSQEVVRELRFRIYQKTGLTASAGISVNGMLAKVCSDKNKPNGQFYLEPTEQTINEFISLLPIRKVPGIGAVSEAHLKDVGVTTCGDILEKSAILYLTHSLSSFKHLIRLAIGIGTQHFGSAGADGERERKSISCERTFGQVKTRTEQIEIIKDLCNMLSDDIRDRHLKGKTVTLKYKTVEFDVKTRAQTLDRYIWSSGALFQAATNLLDAAIQEQPNKGLSLRLMGVRLSALASTDHSVIGSPKKDSPIFLSNNAKINEFLLPRFTNPTTTTTTDDESSNLSSKADDENSKSSIPAIQQDGELAAEKPSTSFAGKMDKNSVTSLQQEATTNTNEECQKRIADNQRQLDGQALEESNEIPAEIANVEDEKEGEQQEIEEFHSSMAVAVGHSNVSSVCPVCDKEISASTEDLLNSHVEECLNRNTIKEILEEQRNLPSTSNNRPPSVSSVSKADSKGRKRPKSSSSKTSHSTNRPPPKMPTINKYFHKL